MVESPVRIENRAQLTYVLSEACELEHGLSCCYQFCAFTLKTKVGPGVNEQQLKAMKRWKRTILNTAIDEMFHLALACNLLTAVGGAPHLRRPNFPASPRMYPPGFMLTLTPFSEETLERFVFTERPEEMLVGPEGYQYSSHPLDRPADIFPGGQVYETVGHLYRAVEDGLRYLVDKHGGDRLFVAAELQTNAYGIAPALNLDSAIATIEEIVEQGEGARGDLTDSHYARFAGILEEYRTMKAEDPSFEPVNPSVSNPYGRVPGDVHPSLDVSLIDDSMTVSVANLFDGAYDLLVRTFARMFGNQGESPERLAKLAEVARLMMMTVISPLGTLLTTLPAGPSHPGMTAGPGFHVLRDLQGPPHEVAAWDVFRERLRELMGYAALTGTFDGAPEGLDAITNALAAIQSELEE